jgi:hypothetical protein
MRLRCNNVIYAHSFTIAAAPCAAPREVCLHAIIAQWIPGNEYGTRRRRHCALENYCDYFMIFIYLSRRIYADEVYL